MSEILASYRNGNNTVTIYEDGTKIRVCDDDVSVFDFPETIDINISNRCYNNCAFCYLNCTVDGPIAHLWKFEKLFGSIPPYVELAINYNHGGIDSRLLYNFLLRRKINRHIVNLTVNQKTFLTDYNRLKSYVDDGLVQALGISIQNVNNDVLDAITTIPNTVVHTIVGVTSPQVFYDLYDRDIKLLILGYKNIGRGVSYSNGYQQQLKRNRDWLYRNIDSMFTHFDVIGFDCNAVKQLDCQRLTKDFDKYYLGDDGTCSMYLDLVQQKYYKSSTHSDDEFGRPLTDDIRTMFKSLNQ